MNEPDKTDTTPATPDAPPTKRLPGQHGKQPRRGRRRLRPQNATANSVAQLERINRCKSAENTHRSADVLLGKIERAEDCNRVMEKYGKALLAVPDDQVNRLAVENPKACSIVFGIAGQNLQRLTEKTQSPVAINLDLSGIANAASRLRDNERRRVELEARLERLQRSVEASATKAAVVDVPASAVFGGRQGEAKSLVSLSPL